MTITEAVHAALRKYAVFSGRATRKEFWSFMLFAALTIGVSALLAIGLAVLAWMALVLLGVGIRRRRQSSVLR